MGSTLSLPKSVIDGVREVAEERRRGAWWCINRLVQGISEACRSGELVSIDRELLARAVENSNPSMAAIRNLASIIRRASDICSTISKLESYLARARSMLIKRAREFVKRRIATISFSSAVAEAILAHRDIVELVWVLESQPGGEGADLYRYLLDRGINARLIPDSMVMQAVEESDIVLVGADAIDGDGCIVNKIGTRMLAALAYALGKPMVVLAEAIKITLSTSCKDLAQAVKRVFKVSGIDMELPVFEFVEPRYVMYIVTDLGLAIPVPASIESIYEKLIRILL